METNRALPLNLFKQQGTPIWMRQILIYLLLLTGILVSVRLLQTLKAKPIPSLDLVSRPAHGWSLDIKDE